MRNARYGSPQTPNFHPPSPSHSPQPSPRLGPSPLNSPAYTGPPGPPTPGPGPGSRPVSPASNAQPHPNPYPSRFPSQGPNASPIPNGAHSPIPSLSQEHLSHPGLHPRVDSSVSVYSNYSYYELPPTPTSPNGSQSATPPGSALPQSSPLSAQHYMPPTPMTPTTPATPVTPSRQRAKSNASKTKVAGPALANPQTPQDYLQLGIQYHLENKLVESAAAFEKSATLDGGCGVGMLMWGLAQRHGWGCEKNEGTGFKWLRRAAELAVGDLEKGQQLQGDMSAVKSELVLAIYEVGQSFFRGWGVQKDKEMAVQYYRVAARLGDPDAQQELAFCLLNGKGCKKDKKESAKWYRAAVQQGVSDIGLAWIYKDKYQDS
ncbi:hypothetical protein C8Q80DRAFT_1091820 [Daedaleopsis nitida]|nr:hypothetical protein C8Q80DRAFT_1091820 [Daedaleopsis nitida]